MAEYGKLASVTKSSASLDPSHAGDGRMRTTRAAKTQVLSCGCICRAYDGKMVVANKWCTYHRVHPDLAVKG